MGKKASKKEVIRETIDADVIGVPTRNRKRKKIVSEEIKPDSAGGVVSKAVIKDEDGETKSSVRYVTLKQIKKRKQVADNKSKRNIDDAVSRNSIESTVKKSDDEKSIKELGGIKRVNKRESKLDSIVSNLKSKDAVDIAISRSSDDILRKRILEIEKEKMEGTKKEESDEMLSDDEKVGNEEVKKQIDTVNKIETEIDEYIKRTVALPKDKGGAEIAKTMKPYLEKLTLDKSTNISKEDVELALKLVERNPVDYKNIAMTCPEDTKKCHYENCPLKSIGKAPVGKKCVVELAYIDKLLKHYMSEILYDDDDVLGVVEYNLIVSLVDCDVTDLRLRSLLNKMGYLVDDVSANPASGGVIINKKVNPIIKMMEVNDRRKATVLRQLLATPEIKARLNLKKKSKQKSGVGGLSKKRLDVIVQKAKEHEGTINVELSK